MLLLELRSHVNVHARLILSVVEPEFVEREAMATDLENR